MRCVSTGESKYCHHPGARIPADEWLTFAFQCDEQRPCEACVRHGTHCSLLDRPLIGEPSAGSRQNASRSSGSSIELRRNDSGSEIASCQGQLLDFTQSGDNGPLSLPNSAPRLWPDGTATSKQSSVPRSPNPFSYFIKSTNTPVELVCSSKWITDLELMHHFTTVTYFTLPGAREVRHVWQIDVPKMAVTHVYLMHQVLALSALHLGYLRPEHRHVYALHASQHQNDAIPGMREALTQTTPENCHALFAAASLLLISGYASFPYPRSETETPTLDDILNVFRLVRGMHEILTTHEDIIQAGPFHEFFVFVPCTTPTPLIDAVVEHLHKVQARLRRIGFEPAKKAEIDVGLASLLHWIQQALAMTNLPELRITITWPIDLSDGFMTLLRHRDPAALTLLADYCVIVRATESSYWYTQGWGFSAARAIASSLESGWDDINWSLAVISNRTVQR